MTHGGLYVQDDYRASRSLTLNLGLRWDLFTHPVDKFNRHVNFNPTIGKFIGATPSNRGPNIDTYYGNLAPRVGFAYSPDGGRTAIRGAAGISYFSYNYGATGGTLERNFPLFQSFNVVPTVTNRPFTKLSVDGLPNFVPTPVTEIIEPIQGIQPYYIPQDVQQAGIYMYNAGVQRQLTGASSIDISFVGTRGVHLYRNRNINTVLSPSAGAIDPRRPYYTISPKTQNIIARSADGVSRYNSLQLKYTRRMANGLQALVSYTYAESKDDTSIFWVWDDTLNYNPMGVDFRHVASIAWTYELPIGEGRQFLATAPKALDLIAGGWSINGIAWMRTGPPLSVTAANNLLNTGTSNYANVKCSDVNYPKRIEQWFDTSCFVDSTDPYVFGNARPGSLRGPGVVNFDLSAFKTFKFQERRSLEFRAEFFNAFNNPHFGNPTTGRSSGNYGRITGTTLTPREIQLGLKLLF
jgi:hypothetical protein